MKKVILAVMFFALILAPAHVSEAWFFGGGNADSGVTVTWDSAEAPEVQDGYTVTIAAGFGGTLYVPEDATITIRGSVSNVRNWLLINLPESSTVIWEAEITADEVWISNRRTAENVMLVRVRNVLEGQTERQTAGTLLIQDGRIEHTANFTVQNFAFALESHGKIVINGGIVGPFMAATNVEINGGILRSTADFVGVILSDDGDITINGGNINFTTRNPGIASRQGTITVNGGTITSGGANPFQGRRVTIGDDAIISVR